MKIQISCLLDRKNKNGALFSTSPLGKPFTDADVSSVPEQAKRFHRQLTLVI